jgi:hypothetical protein|nr:MAG TPA: hypothetical protein [Bacteriophage sp.]
MLKLKKMADFESANYHGFTLKNGFWYGVNTETGNPIATSTWESNGCLSIYEKVNGEWEMDWFSIEETDFELETIPTPNTEGKLSFSEWLYEEYGITIDEWSSYREIQNEQIEDEYDYYYYELPKFVQKYLQK